MKTEKKDNNNDNDYDNKNVNNNNDKHNTLDQNKPDSGLKWAQLGTETGRRRTKTGLTRHRKGPNLAMKQARLKTETGSTRD